MDEAKLISMFFHPADNMEIVRTFLLAAILLLILAAAYRLSHRGIAFEKKFLVTLCMLGFISAALMELIQTNLAVSLGMVGSLSIVRFRTNIHDTRDMGFLFWAMAIGLASAVDAVLIGVAGSLLLFAFTVFTGREDTRQKPVLVIVRGSRTSPEQIQSVLDLADAGNQVRAKNVMSDSYEMVYEAVLPKREDHALIHRLFLLKGVDSVNILARNTEVLS